MMVVKQLQKNSTIQAIKHVFVWRIMYEQHVANVSVMISKKKCQGSCGKLAYHVSPTRNADFTCKTPNQAPWKHV
jgi:hypothetical protein